MVFCEELNEYFVPKQLKIFLYSEKTPLFLLFCDALNNYGLHYKYV